MKTNRREFIGYSATTVAAITTGSVLSASAGTAERTPSEDALAALSNNPFASSAMPGMFTPVVDATGFENHNQ